MADGSTCVVVRCLDGHLPGDVYLVPRAYHSAPSEQWTQFPAEGCAQSHLSGLEVTPTLGTTPPGASKEPLDAGREVVGTPDELPPLNQALVPSGTRENDL